MKIEILILMEERSLRKEDKDIEKYERLNKEIKERHRVVKEEWLNNKLPEVKENKKTSYSIQYMTK